MSEAFPLQILGVVALLRKAYPKIDNFYVPIVAIVVGVVLTFAFSVEFPTHSWMSIVQDGARYALAAVGVTSGIGYAGQKFRGAVEPAAPPASKPGPVPAQPAPVPTSSRFLPPPSIVVDPTVFEQLAPASSKTLPSGAP